MKSCAVFIATTGGPVQVLQLTPERAPQSMVCVNRTTNVLPVSKLYDQFVKPGSGVVEREFGPFDAHSFRVDVSGPIDTGNSWQLGMYLVHALHASPEHRLVEDIAAADEIIWATGCVDYHLNVTEVDHVAAKIQATLDLFAEWAGLGKAVAVITAAGVNESDARAAAADHGVQVFGAENAGQAGEILGLAGAPNSALVISGTEAKSGSARNIALATLILVLAGGAVFAALQPEEFAEWSEELKAFVAGAQVAQEEPAPPAPIVKPVLPPAVAVIKPKPTLPKITVAIKRLAPPAGGTCMQVHFGGADPVMKSVQKITGGDHGESGRGDTCGLRFEFDGTGKYLAAFLRVKSGRFVQAAKKPASLAGSLPVSGAQTWTIQLPQKAEAPFAYDLAVLSSDTPLGAELARLQGQEDLVAALSVLAKKQIKLAIHNHRVSAR